MFKTTWKSYFKNNEKIPGNLLKNLEISWNFCQSEKVGTLKFGVNRRSIGGIQRALGIVDLESRSTHKNLLADCRIQVFRSMCKSMIQNTS